VAESSVGDIVARLRVDTSAWTQGFAQAQQQLNQFAQQVTQGQAQQSAEQTRIVLQASRERMQAERIAAQASMQESRQAAQAQTQAARLAAQERIQSARSAAQAEILEFRRAQEAARQVSAGTSSALQHMFQIAGGIGLATSMQAIVSSLKEFVVQSVQVAARMEGLRASFSALAGSTTAGQQQFQQLFDMAQRVGVAFEPLAQGWRRLTAAATQAQVPLSTQSRLLETLANESRRLGLSSEEMQRVLTGVSQVFSKGTLSMEEMRQQIGEGLPTAMAALARGLGVTTAELTKMIETGTIGARTFASAFTRGLGEVQASGTQMADGMIQAFNRLGNAILQLRDTLVKSGLAQYLTTVLGNIREVVEWTNKMMAGTPTTVPIGPNLGELGVSEENIRRLQQVDAAIARAQAGVAGARTTQRREELQKQLEGLTEIRDQILESGKATQAQADAQAKVTAEANKTTSQMERQVEYADTLRKALDERRKAEEAFRKEAALAPERLGRPAGTPEERIRFQQGLQKATEESLTKITTLAAQPPAGVTVPADLQKDLAALDVQYGKNRASIDAIRDAEQERQRAARAAAAEEERAAGQLIQIQATVQRAKEFMARSDETEAQRAMARIREQGIAQQRAIEQAILQYQQSAALRRRDPGMLQDLEAIKAALPQIIQTQELQAFNQAMEQNVIAPLEQLAAQYGLTKQARDADKASMLAAQAAGTTFAAQANALADTVRRLADAAQQTRLDRLSTEVTTLLRDMSGVALSPLETELAKIADRFRDIDAALLKAYQDYERTWESASPEQRQQIATQLNAIAEGWQNIGRAQEEAMQRAREAPGVALLERMQARLEQMGAPRGGEAFPFEESREQIKLRQEAARANLTPEQQQQFRALDQQIQRQREALYAIGLFEDLASSVGNAWTQALTNIADGTARVSDAFKAMAKSILQSISQIASQEAFRALIRIGAGLITSAFGGGASANAIGGGSGFGSLGAAIGGNTAVRFQGGGFITKPTMALLGEGPSYTKPEVVMNRPQLEGLMASMARGGDSAGGGSSSGVTVMNFPSREAAEAAAPAERARNRQVVLNEVLTDLQRGSASQIGRMLRLAQT